MEFQAQTEDDIATAGLIEKGEYGFEVAEAVNAQSKSGRDMIRVKLCIFLADGKTRYLTDYLLPAMAAKLRHFCDAAGLLPQYQRGSLCAEDCSGRTGTARISIEMDKDGKYPPKNTVQDYVIRPTKPLSSAAGNEDDQRGSGADDNLPF